MIFKNLMGVGRHKQNVGTIRLLLFQSARRNFDQKISSDRKKSLSQRTDLKSADPLLRKGEVLLQPRKIWKGLQNNRYMCWSRAKRNKYFSSGSDKEYFQEGMVNVHFAAKKKNKL